MTTPDLWAICFARQAAADFNTWKRLRNQKDPKYPECHVNQFLQMACEKICKSFLITHGSDPSTLQGSHAYIAKNLHTIIAQQISLKNENVSKHKSLLAHVKRLAGEVDRLSPSVDREQRPDNCEYPWAQGNNVYSPLDHHFYTSDLLLRPHGRTFEKLLALSILQLFKQLGISELPFQFDPYSS